ncbi:MAG: DNA-processing protein DprA [Planctomycetia bacterium]|nr:DNA-processing protein DprA [Planctomycetia bacterium]
MKQFDTEEILDEILLSMIDGIGPILNQRLLQRFGSATEILAATKDKLLQTEGIGNKLASQIEQARHLFDPRELVDQCRKENIQILIPDDSRYPTNLKEIDNPPTVLYVKGSLEPIDSLAISIVGTRNCSYYGKKVTKMLASGLSIAGFTIVSGMAIGIDGAAHEAALEANGRTIAVLGSGLLNIFPQEHKSLSEKIIANGALISEFPPTFPALSGNFPRRNRIVSGLSLGVIVAESPKRSGSLITARMAMEQNREVFAVPGPVDHENSRGCHQLIRDGATLVESVDDVFDVLGPLTKPVQLPDQNLKIRNPTELLLNERELLILNHIQTTPTPIDQIIEETNLLPHQVLGTISLLEFRKVVKRCEANTVRRI